VSIVFGGLLTVFLYLSNGTGVNFVAKPQWLPTGYMVPPAGVHKSWGLLQVEWDRIPKEVCRNVIESMPRRIEAMIKAKEAQTKY